MQTTSRFWQLSEPVTGIEPSQILREAPLVGDLLTIVGFGATGTPTAGSDGSFGTKRFGFTTIDEVTATLVNWEFDDPNETNTAPGDSGGPGYLEIDGDSFIACITSGGTEPDAGLGDLAFNTRVDAYADWIDDTIFFSMLPVDDEPTNDEPTDDEPTNDESVDESDCHVAIGDRPFPFLQWLIHFLWTLLQWLDDDSSDDSDAAIEPATGAAEPEVPEPEVPEPECARTRVRRLRRLRKSRRLWPKPLQSRRHAGERVHGFREIACDEVPERPRAGNHGFRLIPGTDCGTDNADGERGVWKIWLKTELLRAPRSPAIERTA